MRVLGVDPGLTRCGVGIIDGAVGSPLSLVEVGVILTPVDAPLEQRLLDLDQQLSQWINMLKECFHNIMFEQLWEPGKLQVLPCC